MEIIYALCENTDWLGGLGAMLIFGILGFLCRRIFKQPDKQHHNKIKIIQNAKGDKNIQIGTQESFTPMTTTGEQISVEQNSARNSKTTQIGTVVINTASSQEIRKIAIDLFEKNFPQLEEKAKAFVRERVDEFLTDLVQKIQKGGGDFSAFQDPDLQYCLVQAEKAYARRGTKELLNMLSTLLANRIFCHEDDYQKIILDKAIEVVGSLKASHLDYMTLLFLYKHTVIKGLDEGEIIEFYSDAHKRFKVISSNNIVSYLNSLGLLELRLGAVSEILSDRYKVPEITLKKNLPIEHRYLSVNYGLNQLGLVLAIFNANLKYGEKRYDLNTWIKE